MVSRPNSIGLQIIRKPWKEDVALAIAQYLQQALEGVGFYDCIETKLSQVVAAPRKASERPAARQVTFLELFYDLVYVVLIAELAHALAGHIDASGLVSYAFLFVVVWWAWLNGTTYHDITGNNDIRTRVFTFLQSDPTVAINALEYHPAVDFVGPVDACPSVLRFSNLD